jgi:hypothetical protein
VPLFKVTRQIIHRGAAAGARARPAAARYAESAVRHFIEFYFTQAVSANMPEFPITGMSFKKKRETGNRKKFRGTVEF